MKQLLVFLFLSTCLLTEIKAQLIVTEVGKLPVSVSNNAVCEGFIDGKAYLYSFGGIDSTKKHSGIHLKSFRYDVTNGSSLRIPDLPDTLGKIAAGASRIGNIIYVAGGYHVFDDRSELSSNKLHRFDIEKNEFISDGPNIPTATDDHVQAVWRKKLIYLITGWSDVSNIALVQIYDPTTNSWSQGTPVPNSDNFKSFGASGSIIGDTIYYFGGASSASGFRIQKTLRKGIINPDDPTEITWSVTTPSSDIKGYRMAATTVNNTLHWLGGSLKTYNYNGIAYNGTGGVEPSHRDLSIVGDFGQWKEEFVAQLPMDLRGIANINDTLKFLMGGMVDGQTVTNRVYRLTWPNTSFQKAEQSKNAVEIYPNPVRDKLNLKVNGSQRFEWKLYSAQGKVLYFGKSDPGHTELNITSLKPGCYLLQIRSAERGFVKTLIKE